MHQENSNGYVPPPQTGKIRLETVYVSGPMVGRPNHNFAEFDKAAAVLRLEGYSVFNPAESSRALNNNESWWSDVAWDPARDRRHSFMRVDLQAVLRADLLVVLDGWKVSRGAHAEILVAQECGIPVLDFVTRQPVVENLWENLTASDRLDSTGQ